MRDINNRQKPRNKRYFKKYLKDTTKKCANYSGQKKNKKVIKKLEEAKKNI